MPARGRGLFSLNIYIENFRNLLVRNHWTDFNIIQQKCFFGDLLLRLFKPSWFVKKCAARGWAHFFQNSYTENFKNFLVWNHWTDSNIKWYKCPFDDPLSRLFKLYDSSKKIAIRERGLFSLYTSIYIETLKYFCEKPLYGCQYNLAEMFLRCPLPRLLKPAWFVKKYRCQRAGRIYLYIYVENFKNILVRKNWTHFNITWQICFFDDPLPRCSSHHDSSIKHGRQGAWLIFSIYLYR